MRTKPTLRGVLIQALLTVGLALSLLGTVAEHLQYRRALDRKEARHARFVAGAVASAAKQLQEVSELGQRLEGLALEAEATGLALLGGTPARVLAGSEADWTGRAVSEIPALAGSGRLAELLRRPLEGAARDPLLDRLIYVYPTGVWDRGLDLTSSAVLVQLDAGPSRRELWGRTASVACFMIGLLGILGLVMLRMAQRHAIEPLGRLEQAVRRQASGDMSASVPERFSTREFSEFGSVLDEMVHTHNLAHRDLQRSEAELGLLGQITRIADRAEDFDEALCECCAQICRFLCWPIGHVYLVDEEDRTLLRPSDIWHVSCPDLASSFVEETRTLTFREGEGLPGRVLQYKEPVWVPDVAQEDWFVRSQEGDGRVRAAAGFPIFMAQEVIAVLEIFDLKPREREVRHVALMHNIGLTLGQVLQRRQHHELAIQRNRDLVEAMQVAVSATQSKTAFLANMSHEIRTPLTSIVGYAELLRVARTEEERADYVETVRRNGQHLLELINDILDVSKVEAGRLEVERIECSPAEILSSVSQLLEPKAREKQLEFRESYDGLVPSRAITDPTRLQQILLNLISNAVKFTEQGEVHVRVGLATPPDHPCPLLRFTIEDTGIGIPADKMERLFLPFSQADMSTTRRFGGTGLGLSISKSLVELLGGELQVRSEAGRGSRFSFTIETGSLEGVPLFDRPMEPAPRAQPKTAETRTIRLDGKRILVAEDGTDNQRLITKMLTSAGAKVEIVENGAVALERGLAAAEAAQLFDVIFMDMQMPVMDGYEATQKLRQGGYTGRVVALTANAMKGDRERCMEAGCDDFVSKPIERACLLASVIVDLDEDGDVPA